MTRALEVKKQTPINMAKLTRSRQYLKSKQKLEVIQVTGANKRKETFKVKFTSDTLSNCEKV